MIQRSWIRIPAPNTGRIFFTYICCKNCNDVCLKRPKINDKRGRGWPFFYKNTLVVIYKNRAVMFAGTLGSRRAVASGISDPQF